MNFQDFGVTFFPVLAIVFEIYMAQEEGNVCTFLFHVIYMLDI